MSEKLTESNIAECQKKFNLSYHVPFAYLCQQLVGFEGKNVLEVGGSLPKEFVFNYLKVKSWTAIETPDYEVALQEAGGLSHKGTILGRDHDDSHHIGFSTPNLENYNFCLANIEDLPDQYYHKYDLIFSIAAFEHIQKLSLALRKMFLALKPSGKLFSMFSPIWSAPNGHHLPKITDKQGKIFDFSNSPIPPWGHLLLRPQELCNHLCQFTDIETAELAVYYVYNSSHINRFFTEDYIDFIEQSPFVVERLERVFVNEIDSKIQDDLSKLYPGRNQFNNNGLLIILERALNSEVDSSDTVESNVNPELTTSGLNFLIPPDIKNDEFYNAIQNIAREESVQTILEIGSSAGEGSTEALVTGIKANPNQPTLFCIEVSTPRFGELQKRYANENFVKCYNVSSVPLETFPEEKEVVKFYETHREIPHGLGIYSLQQVLSWLRQNIDYVNNSGVEQNGISLIKNQNNIDSFDVVLIDGSQFTGKAELDELYGAKFILLDDINTLKNHDNYQRLIADPDYILVTENKSLRHGYAIFRNIDYSFLPIHFFTIVLNGEPFIRYHIEVFKQLPFKWHWHIVEGVADLKHDTAWVLQYGGHIIDEMHYNGRSNDGTTEYLDELARQYPDQITIYRKPEGIFWDGKREMVNAPLSNIKEECLLWQVDSDEFWTVQQICQVRQLFISNPAKTAAFYWCWFFVGNELIVSTRNCYSQNPHQEWLRTWRYKPGYTWASHSPPRLVETLPNSELRDVATINPFLHEETEKEGLIFQHFAYTTPKQLQFKEQYYGYQNAVANWSALQEQTRFPVLLRQYFPWVRDTTQVERAESVGIVPIAKREDNTSNWQFIQPEELPSQSLKINKTSPIIIVDGVFFQLFKTGIARVWKSLLEEWADNGFAQHIIFLDRAGTAPEIPGIRYRAVPPYDYYKTNSDQEVLQQICDQEGADLFISTYYTTPVSTPSVFMAYDMIPEVMGWNLNHPMWQAKHHAIRYASTYIAISENTARDLVKFFPDTSPESVTVASCGVKPPFLPATVEEVNGFKTKYGISKPYFIVVGAAGTGSYKNSILFFQAFTQLYSRQGFDIVVTGSGSSLAPELRAYTSGSVVHMLQLSDQELRAAYSGAVALVYPSKYEGFGLPILEAMACGCPVITCANASIPEVAGEAVLYVNDDNVNELANALCDVQKPTVRHSLITTGLEQAKKFSWSKMANQVSSVLVDATLLPFNLKDINLIIFPDWSQPEESLGIDLQKAVKAVAMHPNSSYMTLLIDTSSISDEEATMLLSAVVMNLLMEEDLDVSEGLEISLVGKLSESQWQVLLAHIDARLILEHENQQAIAQAKAESLPFYELDSFRDEQVSSFFLS